MSNPTPAPAPAPVPSSGFSAAQLAKDIVAYSGPAIAVLTIVLNLVPQANVSNGWQAVLTAVIAVLSAVQSVISQRNKAAAVEAAKVAARVWPVRP